VPGAEVKNHSEDIVMLTLAKHPNSVEHTICHTQGRGYSEDFTMKKSENTENHVLEICEFSRLPIGLPTRKSILKCLIDIRFRASFLTLQLHQINLNSIPSLVNRVICGGILF